MSPTSLKKKQNRHQASKVALLIQIIGVLCLSVATYLILSGPYLRLTQITCTIDHQYACPGQVFQTLDNYQGLSLLSLNLPRLRRQLNALMPQAQSISLSLIFPKTLDISATSQAPIVALKPGENLPFLILSAQPAVISLSDSVPVNIPIVTTDIIPSLQVGDLLTGTPYHGIVKTFAYLKFINLTPSTANLVNKTTLIIPVSTQQQAYLDVNGDITRQVTTLQSILRSSTMQPYRVIDLRFDKPVLKN